MPLTDGDDTLFVLAWVRLAEVDRVDVVVRGLDVELAGADAVADAAGDLVADPDGVTVPLLDVG